MIRNLNQMNFQGFGTVLSERNQPQNEAEKECGVKLRVTKGEAEVFRATSETLLRCGCNNSILAVSLDGENFQRFYLDKSVRIGTGVYYSVSPLTCKSSVRICAATHAEVVGTRSSECVRVDRTAHIEGLYTFFYHEKEQGFLFPGEAHGMYELTYVDQGSMHSVADGLDLLLKQGDIVLYAPSQWHMQYSDIGVAPRYVTITFDLSGIDLTPLMNRKFTAPQQAVSLLQQMLQEQERTDQFSTDMIISQLTMLLVSLLREAETPSGSKLRTSNAIHSENEIIRQAQQYISDHIREKLSVPLVARQVDVSPSYLTALFHKNLQISPGEYIRRIKLQESKQMIRENDLNFTEIAAALQYSTVHHFSRQFKEKFGITPTEYAKSVRK